jgi:hypothetical protein
MGSFINLHQILSKNFLFNKIQYISRFGCYNNYYANLVNKKFMVTNLNFFIISLKKILFITHKVSLFQGIFLTYVSKTPIIENEKWFHNVDDKKPVLDLGYGFFNKKYLRKKKEKKNYLEKAIPWEKYQEYFLLTDNLKINFFLVLTNGFFGFVSNFKKVFLNHIPKIKKED